MTKTNIEKDFPRYIVVRPDFDDCPMILAFTDTKEEAIALAEQFEREDKENCGYDFKDFYRVLDIQWGEVVRDGHL